MATYKKTLTLITRRSAVQIRPPQPNTKDFYHLLTKHQLLHHHVYHQHLDARNVGYF